MLEAAHAGRELGTPESVAVAAARRQRLLQRPRTAIGEARSVLAPDNVWGDRGADAHPPRVSPNGVADGHEWSACSPCQLSRLPHVQADRHSSANVGGGSGGQRSNLCDGATAWRVPQQTASHDALTAAAAAAAGHSPEPTRLRSAPPKTMRLLRSIGPPMIRVAQQVPLQPRRETAIDGVTSDRLTADWEKAMAVCVALFDFGVLLIYAPCRVRPGRDVSTPLCKSC
jgi:hypothetical protein